MSVLACDRKGCDNVMCDRLSREYGYICNECFNELVELGPNTDIAEFMGQTNSKEFNEKESYRFFNSEFPDVGSRIWGEE